MLKKIIKSYNNGKIALIEKMTGLENGIYDEVFFLDDGYIKSKIERLKKEYNSISKEIEMIAKYDERDNYGRDKLNHLVNKKVNIKFEMAFLASNNFLNIDSCLNLLEEIDTDFKLCLHGLKHYKEGDEKRAFETFYKYFKDKNVLLEHFLINKVYGMLLFNLKQYDISLMVLRKSVEKRPEDKEIHCILKEIYSLKEMELEKTIEENIIELLEG